MIGTQVGSGSGVGTGSGTGMGPLVVTLADPVPADGILVAAWACGSGPGTAFNDQYRISMATDPSGVTWSVAHTGANIGAVGDQGGGTGGTSCYGGTLTRACTAGDLIAGDAVTLTENFSSFPSASKWAVTLVCIPGGTNTAVAWEDPVGSGASVDYSNGDWISFESADGHTLNQGTDFDTHPYPISDCAMLAVSASYPGYAWTPAALDKLGEVVSDVQVALCGAAIAAGTTLEPGGAFAGNPYDGILGFQFAEYTAPPPSAVPVFVRYVVHVDRRT